jgi:hypothetical protein
MFVYGVGGFVLLIIGKFIYSAYCEISKDNMFSLCFVDHEPPGEREIDIGNFHLISLGRTDHWIKVVNSIGLTITNFNVRFIPAEELAKRPTDPPIDMSQIIQVLQVFVTPGVLIQANISTMVNDGYGGIDIMLDRPISWGKGKAIFLKLDVSAKQIWSGKISFQGLDKDNHPRYARADARVMA